MLNLVPIRKGIKAVLGTCGRLSRGLAFEICEASQASVNKLAKVLGCFKGSRQYILSFGKTSP